MGAVMVRCPGTGREIPTGMVADRRSFGAMPVFFGRVFCPICRTEHEWFKVRISVPEIAVDSK